eukprot:349801-Chlamydomonas_euryale.AAC.5
MVVMPILSAGYLAEPLLSSLHAQASTTILPWDGNLLVELSNGLQHALDIATRALQPLLLLILACACVHGSNATAAKPQTLTLTVTFLPGALQRQSVAHASAGWPGSSLANVCTGPDMFSTWQRLDNISAGNLCSGRTKRRPACFAVHDWMQHGSCTTGWVTDCTHVLMGSDRAARRDSMHADVVECHWHCVAAINLRGSIQLHIKQVKDS